MAKEPIKGRRNTRNGLRPGLTPEARENQMISLAVNLAEQKLIDGTAPTAIITHYLNLATQRERSKLKQMELENELLKAKTEAIQSQKRQEELFHEAIEAMRKYSGNKEE